MVLLESVLQHIDSIPYLQSRLDGWTQDLSKMTDQTLQSPVSYTHLLGGCA